MKDRAELQQKMSTMIMGGQQLGKTYDEIAEQLLKQLIDQYTETRVAEARIDELNSFPEFASRYGFERHDLVVEYQDGKNSGVLPSREWLNRSYKQFEVARKQRIAELHTNKDKEEQL